MSHLIGAAKDVTATVRSKPGGRGGALRPGMRGHTDVNQGRHREALKPYACNSIVHNYSRGYGHKYTNNTAYHKMSHLIGAAK